MKDVQTFVLLLKTLPRDWRAVLDRRLQPLGLSQAKWQPLLYLYRENAARTQTEIADYLDIESPTLVRQLDRLAADGWIERKSCPGDRRARHIVLTPQAKKVCAEIDALAMECRMQMLGDITAEELAQCLEILQRIHGTATRLLAAPIHVNEPTKAAGNPASKATAGRKPAQH
jgi:MarR family transcriptional regulator for hemolysin